MPTSAKLLIALVLPPLITPAHAQENHSDPMVREIYTALTITDRTTRRAAIREIAKRAFSDRQMAEVVFWDTATPSQADAFDDLATAFSDINLAETSRWLLDFDYLANQWSIRTQFGGKPCSSSVFCSVLTPKWLARNVRETAEWVSSLTPQRQVFAVRFLLPPWYAKAPEDALIWMETLTHCNHAHLFSETIVDIWAKEAPQATYDWIKKTLGNGRRRTKAVQILFANVARRSPETAAEWATLFSDTRLRDWAAQELMRAVEGKLPPEQIARLVLPISESEQVGRALVDANFRWLTNDPASAAAWATELPSSPARNGAIFGIASWWARADSLAAVRWAMTLRERDMCEAAVQGAAKAGALNRFEESAPEIATWAENLSDPELREIAILGIVESVMFHNDRATVPPVAKWVLSLDGDTTTKYHALEVIGQQSGANVELLKWANTINDITARDHLLAGVAESLQGHTDDAPIRVLLSNAGITPDSHPDFFAISDDKKLVESESEPPIFDGYANITFPPPPTNYENVDEHAR